MQPDPRFQQQPGYAETNPYAPQQNVVVVDPATQQQYIQGVPGQQVMMMVPQNPPQNGLITASYVCSGIGLIIFGIILGPVGFILGLIAKSNGDERGNTAMVFGSVVTVLSIVIVAFIFSSGIY